MSETPFPDDRTLAALLDGELEAGEVAALAARLPAEPALQERLLRLARGGEGIRPALGALAEAAPLDRLDAMLDGLLAEEADRKAAASVPTKALTRGFDWRRWLASPFPAAVAAGIAGLWLGYAVFAAPVPKETWRDSVAEYWALTSPDTLALEPSPDQAGRELALAADRLGLPLSLSAVALPDASFRGAMLLDYDGRPLTQLAYLDPGGIPFAYCVIKAPKAGVIEPTAAVLGGFNVVHWASGGYARMLIGRVPFEHLKRYAAMLRARPA